MAFQEGIGAVCGLPDARESEGMSDLYKTLPPLVTTDEAAALMRVTPRSIEYMCKNGTLLACKAGRGWRINRDAMLEMLNLSMSSNAI